MKKLSNPGDIWVLKPTKEDLLAGSRYAAITLPWTFNRMMMNTGSDGQQFRALNIAKGIVGQEILRRELERRGKKPVTQKKSHRDDDLFDFDIYMGATISKLDIKSINYYSNYTDVGRDPLTAKLIVQNASYPGPDWRRFFPMLVPHTQIAQNKEAYCFVIASSVDTRKDIFTNRCGFALTAFPYGEMLAFISSKRLCLARENAGAGFYINCAYKQGSMFDASKLGLIINGEWDGKLKALNIDMVKNITKSDIGPFSCISSFQLSKENYESFSGSIEIRVSKNEFDEVVLNSLKRNINSIPNSPFTIKPTDFCNLILPNDYTVYILGWITKQDYLKACRKYTGWVWPDDKINKFNNQTWSQITVNDEASVRQAGFEDCIQTKPSLLKAGWMKTTGRGSGACCYVFPNIGHGGGVKETNLFVLPEDLNIMAELGS